MAKSSFGYISNKQRSTYPNENPWFDNKNVLVKKREMSSTDLA
jgi:hypothetical protein